MNYAFPCFRRSRRGFYAGVFLTLFGVTLLAQTGKAIGSVVTAVQAIQTEAQLATAVIAAATDEQRRTLVTAHPQLINVPFRHALAMEILRWHIKGEHKRVVAVSAFARKLAEQRQDKGWIAMTWVDSVGSLDLLGRHNEARAATVKATNVKEFAQDHMALAHVEAVQAMVDYLSEKPPLRAPARQSLEHSLTLLAPEQRLEKGLALCVLGMFEVDNIENGIAQQALQNSLQIFTELGDRFWMALPLHYLGEHYHRRGDTPAAIRYMRQSLDISEELSIQFLLYITPNMLGHAYVQAGERAKALAMYEQSRVEREKLGDAKELSIAYSSLADFLKDEGNYEKALDYAERAVPLSRAAGYHSTTSNLYISLAVIYLRQGNRDLEMEMREKAIPEARLSGDNYDLAYAYYSLGCGYLYRGEYAKANQALQEALQIHESLSLRRLRLSLYANLAYLYLLKHDLTQALSYCERGLQLLEKVYYPSNHYALLAVTGDVCFARAEYQKALSYYQQAFDLAQKYHEGNDFLSGMQANLGKTLHALKQDDEALAHFAQGLTLAESWRSRILDPDARATYLTHIQHFFAQYVKVLMELHAQQPTAGYAAQALQINERSRARSLLDLLTEAKADLKQGADEALLERERDLHRQLNEKSAQLTLRAYKEQVANWENEIARLTIELKKVEAQIRVVSPHYAALARPQPLTVTEIQQEVLDADTLLLQYELGEEQSWLWAVTRTTLTSYALPPRAVIEAAATAVHKRLTAVPTKADAASDYWDKADALSQLILAPVAEQLGQKRLAIVADGILQYLPFGALPKPVVGRRLSVVGSTGNRNRQRITGHRQPLIAEHEIVSLPSASTLAVLRRELAGRKVAPKSVAVLADPVFTATDPRVQGQGMARNSVPTPSLQRALRGVREGLPRLHFSRDEAKAIAAVAPWGTNLMALDFQANRATATTGDLSQYRILHFATHGLLNSTHPELSGLVLSLVDQAGQPQDGFWRLHDIYNLKLNAELVVLSACQTGLGKDIKGEGLVGLTRGFMYAGTPRVVASLWQVDDVATAELMKRFYRGMLQQEQRPAAALRAAQLEMLGKKQWTHPFYWAAFTLQGEWK
jgi:CHAT domain-containing protein